MSLLNDALRKKGREMRQTAGLAAGASVRSARRPSPRRLYWIAGIGTLVLLVLVLGVGLAIHSIEAPSASVLKIVSGPVAATPLPAATLDATVAEPPRDVSPNTVPEGAATLYTKPGADPAPGQDPPETLAALGPGGDPRPLPAAEKIPQDMGAAVPGAIQAQKPEASGPAAPTAPPARATPWQDHRQDGVPESALVERYYRKALSYHRQGRLSRAIALYRDALQLQPQHFEARFNLVSAYIDSGAFDHAHRIAQALHREDGTNQQVLCNLAIAKIGIGQFREALELLDQAANLPQGETFTILLHKGIACRGLDRLDAAIGWYRKAEELNPDHPQLLFNLALAHDRRQDYATALQYYQAYREQVAGGQGQEQSGVRKRMATLRAFLADGISQEAGEP